LALETYPRPSCVHEVAANAADTGTRLKKKQTWSMSLI
jgi:hypothetical protein